MIRDWLRKRAPRIKPLSLVELEQLTDTVNRQQREAA